VITELKLGDITIEVIQKDIKNIHLSVNPPDGEVRISAPLNINPEAIRAFALTKLIWIKEQQQKIRKQDRDIPRDFMERESHFVWGKRYLLSIIEIDEPPSVNLSHDKMILRVRPGTTPVKMKEIVQEWYRDLIRDIVPSLIEKWSPILGVSVEKLFVQQMKTKWGACSPNNGNIRLNSELGKKPKDYLEYVVLHEMAHLLEPTHNERFQAIMDRCMPNWRHLKDELNRLPVPHGVWN